MPQLILGLTGQIGSGKGYVAEYLAKRFSAKIFKFSTYLLRALDVLALEQSRDNLIKMSEMIRAGFGEDALSHALAHDASLSDAPLVVVDGIRRIEDIAGLKSLHNFRLAAVEVDQRTRYERIANRHEKTEETGLTWEDFLVQEKRSTEVTVPETMARATLRLQNNDTIEELERQIDALMTELGIPATN